MEKTIPADLLLITLNPILEEILRVGEIIFMSRKIKYTKSSGNVFEDMGFQDAKQRLVKVDLALKINQIIQTRKLKQREAAKILRINQPKISAMMNGRLVDFSIERLIEFLNKLELDVEIIVKEKPKNTKRHAFFHVAHI